MVKSGDAAESSTAQDVDSEKDVKTKVSETPQSAGLFRWLINNFLLLNQFKNVLH